MAAAVQWVTDLHSLKSKQIYYQMLYGWVKSKNIFYVLQIFSIPKLPFSSLPPTDAFWKNVRRFINGPERHLSKKSRWQGFSPLMIVHIIERVNLNSRPTAWFLLGQVLGACALNRCIVGAVTLTVRQLRLLKVWVFTKIKGKNFLLIIKITSPK